MAHNPLSSVRRGRVALGLLLSSLLFWTCLLHDSQAFVRWTLNNGAELFWPDSQAILNLRLGCPDTPLVNWGPCWDDVIIDAAQQWTEAGSQFSFEIQPPDASTNDCLNDGINTVSFRSTICDGTSFGSAIAITFAAADNNTGELLDTDVIFDANRNWSSYSGPLRAAELDLHRVAIHELGHVVGLVHPDQLGQSVTSIMNSVVGDIDALQPDDVNGIIAIYDIQDTPLTPVGELENPGLESFASGISTISGWVCEADEVTIAIDNNIFQAAYGTTRADTLAICGDTDNGFSLLTNWNLLGDGPHTLVVSVDGQPFATTTFTVTTIDGQEFIQGANGQADISFIGHTLRLQWEESLQNFVIVQAVDHSTTQTVSAGNDRSSIPPVPSSAKAVLGSLENPRQTSFVSGVSAISGWICDADQVSIQINESTILSAGYGTTRFDTLSVCGDTDNGFSLLFNWNLLGDGIHTITALADGEVFASTTFTVTTIGGQEFIQGASGQTQVPFEDDMLTVEWEESLQNFVITDVN